MPDALQATRARRPQSERRAAMRLRLLEATLDCLVDEGYAGATTARIEARAGVSRGARLHHFPTKADLLTEAVDHVYRGLRERFESRLKHTLESGDLPGGDRFKATFRLLWSNFLDPRHAAVLELDMLARSDPELRARLRDVAQRHHDNMQRRARAYFPEAPEHLTPLVPAILESIHAAMEGLALRRVIFGEDMTERQVLDTVEEMSRHFITHHLRREDDVEGSEHGPGTSAPESPEHQETRER